MGYTGVRKTRMTPPTDVSPPLVKGAPVYGNKKTETSPAKQVPSQEFMADLKATVRNMAPSEPELNQPSPEFIQSLKEAVAAKPSEPEINVPTPEFIQSLRKDVLDVGKEERRRAHQEKFDLAQEERLNPNPVSPQGIRKNYSPSWVARNVWGVPSDEEMAKKLDEIKTFKPKEPPKEKDVTATPAVTPAPVSPDPSTGVQDNRLGDTLPVSDVSAQPPAPVPSVAGVPQGWNPDYSKMKLPKEIPAKKGALNDMYGIEVVEMLKARDKVRQAGAPSQPVMSAVGADKINYSSIGQTAEGGVTELAAMDTKQILPLMIRRYPDENPEVLANVIFQESFRRQVEAGALATPEEMELAKSRENKLVYDEANGQMRWEPKNNLERPRDIIQGLFATFASGLTYQANQFVPRDSAAEKGLLGASESFNRLATENTPATRSFSQDPVGAIIDVAANTLPAVVAFLVPGAAEAYVISLQGNMTQEAKRRGLSDSEAEIAGGASALAALATFKLAPVVSNKTGSLLPFNKAYASRVASKMAAIGTKVTENAVAGIIISSGQELANEGVFRSLGLEPTPDFWENLLKNAAESGLIFGLTGGATEAIKPPPVRRGRVPGMSKGERSQYQERIIENRRQSDEVARQIQADPVGAFEQALRNGDDSLARQAYSAIRQYGISIKSIRPRLRTEGLMPQFAKFMSGSSDAVMNAGLPITKESLLSMSETLALEAGVPREKIDAFKQFVSAATSQGTGRIYEELVKGAGARAGFATILTKNIIDMAKQGQARTTDTGVEAQLPSSTIKTTANPAEPAPIISDKNISSNSKGILGALTNPTSLARKKKNIAQDYPVDFEGTSYPDAEAAYKANQNGRGPTPENQDLMKRVMIAKFQQHPALAKYIEKQGGANWLKTLSHKVTGKSEWEGDGESSPFIRTLIGAYSEHSSPAPIIEQQPAPAQKKMTAYRVGNPSTGEYYVTDEAGLRGWRKYLGGDLPVHKIEVDRLYVPGTDQSFGSWEELQKMLDEGTADESRLFPEESGLEHLAQFEIRGAPQVTTPVAPDTAKMASEQAQTGGSVTTPTIPPAQPAQGRSEVASPVPEPVGKASPPASRDIKTLMSSDVDFRQRADGLYEAYYRGTDELVAETKGESFPSETAAKQRLVGFKRAATMGKEGAKQLWAEAQKTRVTEPSGNEIAKPSKDAPYIQSVGTKKMPSTEIEQGNVAAPASRKYRNEFKIHNPDGSVADLGKTKNSFMSVASARIALNEYIKNPPEAGGAVAGAEPSPKPPEPSQPKSPSKLEGRRFGHLPEGGRSIEVKGENGNMQRIHRASFDELRELPTDVLNSKRGTAKSMSVLETLDPKTNSWVPTRRMSMDDVESWRNKYDPERLAELDKEDRKWSASMEKTRKGFDIALDREVAERAWKRTADVFAEMKAGKTTTLSVGLNIDQMRDMIKIVAHEIGKAMIAAKNFTAKVPGLVKKQIIDKILKAFPRLSRLSLAAAWKKAAGLWAKKVEVVQKPEGYSWSIEKARQRPVEEAVSRAKWAATVSPDVRIKIPTPATNLNPQQKPVYTNPMLVYASKMIAGELPRRVSDRISEAIADPDNAELQARTRRYIARVGLRSHLKRLVGKQGIMNHDKAQLPPLVNRLAEAISDIASIRGLGEPPKEMIDELKEAIAGAKDERGLFPDIERLPKIFSRSIGLMNRTELEYAGGIMEVLNLWAEKNRQDYHEKLETDRGEFVKESVDSVVNALKHDKDLPERDKLGIVGKAFRKTQEPGLTQKGWRAYERDVDVYAQLAGDEDLPFVRALDTLPAARQFLATAMSLYMHKNLDAALVNGGGHKVGTAGHIALTRATTEVKAPNTAIKRGEKQSIANSVRMRNEDLLQLAINASSPEVRKEISRDGFRTSPLGDTIYFTEDSLKGLADQLPKPLQLAMKEMLKVYSDKDLWKLIRESFFSSTGKWPRTVREYSPTARVRSEEAGTRMPYSRKEFMASAADSGMLKERTGSGQPFLVGNAFGVFGDYVGMASQLVSGYSESMFMKQAIVNNDIFKQTIKDKMGDFQLELIHKALKWGFEAGENAKKHPLFNALMRPVLSSMVSLNLTVIAIAPLSTISQSGEFSLGTTARALLKLPNPKEWMKAKAEMDSVSPWFFARYEGSNIGKMVNLPIASGLPETYLAYFSRYMDYPNALTLKMGDSPAMLLLWHQLRIANPKMPLMEVAIKANRMMQNYFPSDNKDMRNYMEMAASENPTLQIFTIFKNSLARTRADAIDAIEYARRVSRNKDKTKKEKTDARYRAYRKMSVYMLQQLAIGLTQAVIMHGAKALFAPDDVPDEHAFRNFLIDAGASAFTPAAGVFSYGIRSMMETGKYPKLSHPALEPIYATLELLESASALAADKMRNTSEMTEDELQEHYDGLESDVHKSKAAVGRFIAVATGVPMAPIRYYDMATEPPTTIKLYQSARYYLEDENVDRLVELMDKLAEMGVPEKRMESTLTRQSALKKLTKAEAKAILDAANRVRKSNGSYGYYERRRR